MISINEKAGDMGEVMSWIVCDQNPQTNFFKPKIGANIVLSTMSAQISRFISIGGTPGLSMLIRLPPRIGAWRAIKVDTHVYANP